MFEQVLAMKRRVLLRWFAFWSAIAVLFAVQSYLAWNWTTGSASWSRSAVWAAAEWYAWGLVAPLVLRTAALFPLDAGRRARHLFVLGALAVAFVTLQLMLQTTLLLLAGAAATWVEALRSCVQKVGFELVTYGALIAYAHGRRWYARSLEQERALSEVRALALSAELDALRQQLQPHFLFNTLNGIVGMLEEGAPASTAIVRLGDFLRATLADGGRQMCTLHEDWRITGLYLEIEKMRLGERLSVEPALDAAALECHVPRLLLQPIVENAIRHGIAKSIKGGSIAVAGTVHGDMLRLRIHNSLARAEETPASAGFGIGLDNCRRRLQLLYGGAARLHAQTTASGEFVVELHLPRALPAAHVGRA